MAYYFEPGSALDALTAHNTTLQTRKYYEALAAQAAAERVAEAKAAHAARAGELRKAEDNLVAAAKHLGEVSARLDAHPGDEKLKKAKKEAEAKVKQRREELDELKMKNYERATASLPKAQYDLFGNGSNMWNDPYAPKPIGRNYALKRLGYKGGAKRTRRNRRSASRKGTRRH